MLKTKKKGSNKCHHINANVTLMSRSVSRSSHVRLALMSSSKVVMVEAGVAGKAKVKEALYRITPRLTLTPQLPPEKFLGQCAAI